MMQASEPAAMLPNHCRVIQRTRDASHKEHD